MKNRLCLWLSLTTCSLLISGCAEVTVGPRVQTNYVIVHAGKPMEALANQKVQGRVLDGQGDPIEQDVGGWILMPPDHWDAVKRKLETPPK